MTHAFSHYDLKYSIRIACLLSRSVNHVNSLSPDLPNDLFRVVVSVHTTDAAPKASMWMNLLGGFGPVIISALEPKEQRPIMYSLYLPLLPE